MVPRFAGACLGLLAFFITITAGLYVRNPVEVILSRSILALFVFCLIGFALGGAAQLAIAEYEKNRRSEIRDRFREDTEGEGEPNAASTVDAVTPAVAGEDTEGPGG